MNRRILKWPAFAAAVVAAGVGFTFSGSAAQPPPNGNPANNGPGAPPGRRPGPGQQPPGRRSGPGQPPGPGRNAAPGQQAPGKMGIPGRRGPGQIGAPPAGIPAKGVVVVAAPVPPRVHRRGVDPFRVPWTLPAPPPYVFDDILPVRLADKDIEPPVVRPVTVREEPALRVSGIMTGDGVFAILEQTGDRVDIVKPGSSIDIGVSGGSRTYRVASIKDDTVTLESVEGNTTFQQIVPLSDAPVGTSQASFGNGAGRGGIPPPGSGGGIGIPGGGRPGSGRPGARGGGGGPAAGAK